MKGKLAVGAGILALALGGAPAAMANEPASGLTQSQQASNNNGTKQDAGASATSKQANVNVPINVLTNESGNGNVEQQNSGETQAGSGNQNQTGQSNGQNQQGSTSSKGCCSGSGGSKQSQQATNNNQTDQHAKSDANTHQANVNVPVNVLTNESGNGDVKQENNAYTKSSAGNENQTGQSNRQNQDGSSRSGDGPGGFDQSQEATNNNKTSQEAKTDAGAFQLNVNAPINLLTNESGNGDVRQRNDAKTVAKSENENQTDQSNRQSQQGFSSHKGSCGCRKHDGHKRGEGRHGLIPLWPVAAVEPLPLGGWPLVALGG